MDTKNTFEIQPNDKVMEDAQKTLALFSYDYEKMAEQKNNEERQPL